MKKRKSIYLSALLIITTGCTFSIGWPSRLSDRPAPTSLPLQATSAVIPDTGPFPLENPVALPAGFTISVFARGLDDPRMLAVGPDGQLYAAERGAGQVVRLPDRDADGFADGIEIAAGQLDQPSSLDFYQDGSLYVAETTRILRFSSPDGQGVFQNREIIVDDLPAGHHSTRTLLFSPDGSSLFVSVGSSCNVCLEEDQRRAAILRYNPDGSGGDVYARGLRNAVGITFHPATGEQWATNNGRDLMGDDLPPETVYRIEAGQDYGWPRCHAGRIPDPQFGGQGACRGTPAPQVEIQAHSAPLGLEFYSGEQFPQEYRNGLFVALHGSWNRSVPTGYKVVWMRMDGDKPGPVQDFAVGWLRANGAAWGRPVDVVTGADGSLFISDDAGGVIYRISYSGG